MKFVPISGLAAPKTRPQRFQQDNLQESDVTRPSRLAAILRAAIARIGLLEAKVGTLEPVEFQFNIETDTGRIRLSHGFTGPVRWYITHWQAYGSLMGPPGLAYDVVNSRSGLLVLEVVAGFTGSVIVRVEPSQQGFSVR